MRYVTRNTKLANHIRSAATIFAVLVLSFSLTGCEFDPTENVQSTNQPENHVTDDGITWVPERLGGTADSWFYVPEEVAVAAKYRDPSAGFQMDILTHGKIFRITRDADGAYSYSGRVDSDISANPEMILLAIILGIAVLISIGVAIYTNAELTEEKKKTTAEKQNAKTANDEVKRITKEKEEWWKQFQAEKTVHAKEQKTIKRELAGRRQSLDADRDKLGTERDRLDRNVNHMPTKILGSCDKFRCRLNE